MVIQPKIRGFVCTTAHPKGCFRAVQEQVDYVKARGAFSGPKIVLVIGASAGYGLAGRIEAAFGGKAVTVGVSFERPADVGANRTASAGWYNTAAFEQLAGQAGLVAKSINGDAFSHAIKQQTIDLLKSIGPVDLVIYSLAAPRRINPDTGEVYNSVLKPIGKRFQSKTVDPLTGIIKEIEIEPATPAEVAATQKVMGGEDWALWIDQLQAAGLLAPKAVTVAFSYLGPKLTHSIYKDGTIGAAKQHLHQTARELDRRLSAAIGGRALISVNKALVTQASSAIPVVPLYISLLYKVMKEQGTHEGCIEQMVRLSQRLYGQGAPILDSEGFIRLDDWEMDPKTQAAVMKLWGEVTPENLSQLADLKGYQTDFYHLFGFSFPGIDYSADCDPEIMIPSIGDLILR